MADKYSDIHHWVHFVCKLAAKDEDAYVKSIDFWGNHDEDIVTGTARMCLAKYLGMYTKEKSESNKIYCGPSDMQVVQDSTTKLISSIRHFSGKFNENLCQQDHGTQDCGMFVANALVHY